MSTALFDIGGTKTRVTVSRNGRTFRKPIAYATPRHYAEGLRQLVDAIRVANDGWKVSRLVGCIAAPLDPKHTRTVHASNLPDWLGSPLRDDVRRHFQAPVHLENDAALAGLGEAHHGAGKGKDIVAYVTLGTGFGGVRIVDGMIDSSAFGFEPGYMTVGDPAARGMTIEQLISGSGLSRRFHTDTQYLTKPAIWREAEQLLALALVNVAVLWSPNVIVIGGTIGRSTRIRLSVVRKIFRQQLHVFHAPPTIVRSQLGDAAGLYGGLALLRKR